MTERSEFGFETTADEVLDGIDMTDRRVLITGGASGLGQETARAMAKRGALIIIAARDLEKGRTAREDILSTLPEASIEVRKLDLADLSSIREFTDEFRRDHDRLDLLINNAGVMACPRGKTKDGFEMQFGTNHLGHFLLTGRLLPGLRKSAKDGRSPRVVTLSSRAHFYSPVDLDDPNYEAAAYDKWISYGRSKTANALFALGLDNRVKDEGVRSFSVHPGGIMTNLGRHLDEADIEALRARFTKSDTQPGFKSIPQGAATSCYAATAPELSEQGGYYLEDCGIAEPNDDLESLQSGVRAWARDPVAADQLWALSEKLVGETIE